jgi:hypothetical protein
MSLGWIIVLGILAFIGWRKLTTVELINPADVVFKSSFLRGGNPIIPEKLIIDEKYVTWRKNRGLDFLFLSINSVTMQRKRITGVVIIEKLIGSDVVVMGEGGQNIRMSNLKQKDALEIKQLLTP